MHIYLCIAQISFSLISFVRVRLVQVSNGHLRYVEFLQKKLGKHERDVKLQSFNQSKIDKMKVSKYNNFEVFATN